MSAFLRKYGTGTGSDVYIPMVTAGATDTNPTWTPAAGDVKISKDGGAAANIGTLPTSVTMGNSKMWKFVFADAELQAKLIAVTVSDSATKAVEDTQFNVETYGHASALHPFDLATATQSVNVTQFGGSAGTFASGRPEVNTTHWGGTAVASAVVPADIQTIKTQTVTCAAGVTVGAYVGGTGAAALETTAQSILTDTAEIGAAGAGLTAITGLIGTPTDFGSGTSTIAANLQDLADNGTATYDRATDSLQAIRDRGDLEWITATGFSTHSAADVWAAGTRTLTANTNLNDPTAAAIADAVWDEATAGHVSAGTFGKAAGDILADTNELQGDWANGGRLDLLIDAILADTGTDGVVLSTATQQAIADALLDRAAGVETSWTVRQALRIILSAAGAKLSGAATNTVTIRDVGDTKDRITATVDADGNRTAVTLDAS